MIIRYVIGAALAVAGLWFVFNIGYDNGKSAAAEQCRERVDGLRSAYAQAEQDARTKAAESQRRAVDKARDYWKNKAVQEQDARIIEKEVIRYVEKESSRSDACQLDADFLRIWNAARDESRNGADAGER